MSNINTEMNLLCHEFEHHLTDYLDGALDRETHRAAAAHALRCPLCHALLNEVKNTLDLFETVEIPPPSREMESRILLMTRPETAMDCVEFEDLLTDYLDGFLPASVFHRWERHAILCEKCTDLPGEVVRTIGLCYTAKADELSLPAGLNQRILQAASGAGTVKFSVAGQWRERLRGWLQPLFAPILTPQFASVTMMLVMAFFVLTNSVSADGSISSVYQTGWQLAAQTYEQSADVVEANLGVGGSGKNPKVQTIIVQPTSENSVNGEDQR